MSEKKVTWLGLAIPLFFETVLKNLMSTIATAMMKGYGDEAVSAIGVANQYLNMAVTFFTIAGTAAGIIISQYLGANDKKMASVVSTTAMSTNFVFGTVVGVFSVFISKYFAGWMGLTGSVADDCTIYLRYVVITAGIQGLISTASAIFRNYGNPRIPMYVLVFANLLAIFGNYLVIYKPGVLPIEGVGGIGIIRLFSDSVACIIMLAILFRSGFEIDFKGIFHPDIKVAGRVIGLGFVSGMEGIAYNISSLITTGFLTSFGVAQISGKVYLNSILCYVFVAGMTLGQANQILVGRAVGAGDTDEADRLTRRTSFAVLGCNIVLSLACMLFAAPLFSIFTDSPEILKICSNVLYIDIFVEIGRALSHIYNNALRGSGYVKIPALVSACSMLLVGAGLAGFFGATLKMGIYGIWAGMACDELIRGGISFVLWKKGVWKKTNLIGREA